jgi:hypothetical protein
VRASAERFTWERNALQLERHLAGLAAARRAAALTGGGAPSEACQA